MSHTASKRKEHQTFHAVKEIDHPTVSPIGFEYNSASKTKTLQVHRDRGTKYPCFEIFYMGTQ